MGCNKTGLIVRGTTPTIVITYRTIDVSEIKEAYLTIEQPASNVVINKTLSAGDASVEENALRWSLSQEDTLQIQDKYPLKIQCRYLLNDDTAGSSPIYEMSPYSILKDGVIE